MDPKRFDGIKTDDDIQEDRMLHLGRPEYGYTFWAKGAQVPIEFLYDLLEKVAIKYYDYYCFNYTSYRKVLFMNLFDDFANTMISAYSAKYRYIYLEKRPVTYQTMVTIMRHICKKNGVPCKSVRKLKLNSEQNRDFCIYRPPDM